jgi:hypothetical protein
MKQAPFTQTAGANANRSEAFGFLHIGKTAGTSVVHLIQLCEDHGYRPPRLFGHDARLPVIRREHPNIRIGFFVRDPIARIISGFQSRLRQGRPTFSSMWAPEEAIAFAYFETARDFLVALVSDDERLKSAALFAAQSISHVRRNYAFHFENVETLQQHRESIYFCRPLRELPEALHDLFGPCGIPRSFIDEHYQPAHRGGGSTEAIMDALDGDVLERLRAHFANEYAIYGHLSGLRPQGFGRRIAGG